MPCGELSPVKIGVSTTPVSGFTSATSLKPPIEPPLNAMIGALGSSPVSLTL